MTCCFDLFVGPSLASAWMREGAFLLTPGWLARWRDYIQEWGFDQAGARQFFEESIPRLVLLDTGVDPDASKHLDAFASFVARPSHVMPVGLDYLRDHLVRRVLAWRLQHQQASSAVALGDANRMLSDYAMSYDIVGRLAGMKSKSRVIEAIFELFGMLCAPRIMVFLPLRSGKPGQARFMPQSASEEPDVLKDMAELTADHAWTPSKSGFLLRLGSEDDPVGVLKLEGIAFPQYREHYLNLGIHLAQVCSLAVSNARAYELLEGSLTQLREAMANIRTLRGIIPICAACKKIRDDKGFWNQVEAYVQQHSQAQFTHGLCPDCISKYYP